VCLGAVDPYSEPRSPYIPLYSPCLLLYYSQFLQVASMNMGNTKMHNVDMWHVEVLMVESPRLLVFFNKFHTFDAENPFESEFRMMKSIFVLVDSPLLTAHSLFLAV